MPGPGDKLKPGKVSGKKPLPIDRSLFAEALSRPINYGDNVISNDIEGLDPGAISGIGHKYYSGSTKGGDLVTTNGKDYFIYNKQGNQHGLVNIGSNPFKNTSPTVPVVTTPSSTLISTPSTTIATKQTVDPNYKPMVFGQGQNYNPNTGKYYNPDTGAEITPVVTGGQKQVPMKETGMKKGGLVKNYSTAGLVTDPTDPTDEMTPEEQEEFQFQQAYNEGNAEDDAIAAKSKADRQASLAGDKKKPMSQADQATLVGVGVQGAEMGAGYIDSKNQLNDDGYTDVKKATASAALRGAGKGAGIGASIGSVIPGVGTAVGAGAGAVIGGVAGGITGNKKAKAFNDDVTLEHDEQAREEKARNAKLSVSGALAERGFADGGKVEGPGTGTSDSITKKKIKPGAFVVPAKNAEVAEELREKVLGDDPDKKADLNQYSGKPNANLSNGEHIFTPEEVKELTAKGIDLDDLAPEAKTKLRNEMNMAKGGPVPPKKKIIVSQERAQMIADKKNQEDEIKAAKAKSEAENKIAANRAGNYNALERQLSEQKNSKAALAKAEAEYNAILDSYNTFKKQSDTALNQNEPYRDEIGASSRPDLATVQKNQEELLRTVEARKAALDKAKKAVEYSNDERNYIKQELPRGDNGFTQNLREAAGKTSVAPKYLVDPNDVPGANAVNKAKAEYAATQTTPQPNTGGLAEALRPTPNVAAMEAETAQPPQVAPPSGGIANNVVAPPVVTPPVVAPPLEEKQPPPSAQTDKVGGILSAINGASQYLLPAVQTGLGFSAARELGKRPVGKIDPDYLNAIDEARTGVKIARANANFGMTPAEKFATDQNNQNLLNAERYDARSVAGGPANAINLERSAINNSYGRGINAMIADNQLKLAKQGRADNLNSNLNSMIADKAGMSRQLFGDTLNAWQQDSNVAGALIGSGLNNAIAAGRYNNELEYAKKRDAKYNV